MAKRKNDKGQKWSTKHYMEHYLLNTTNQNENLLVALVFRLLQNMVVHCMSR